MRAFSHRVLVAFAATLVAAACGLFAGYLVGRTITLNLAREKLVQYATRIMNAGESSSAESRAVLAQMNASPYPPCSDAERGYFRRLIFQSEYLKDGGRIQDGRILCSTTLGRVDRIVPPLALSKPDFSQQDGTEVYRDAAPFRVGDMTVISLQSGNSYIVFSPYILMHLGPSPMHYTITVIDAPSRHSGRLLGELPPAKSDILTRDGEARLGDSLYATRCSIRFFNCITAFISIPEALRADLRQFTGYIVAGGLAGSLFGLVISLIYRRNRSMEQQLLRAIREDRLSLVYQPIVDLNSRRIVGAEALVRWTDDNNFAVGPDVFVKRMEERGYAGAITKLVVRHALRDFAATLRGSPSFRLNINVAAADLSDPEFLPMLSRSVHEAGIPPESLGIEITESSTARHQIAMDAIRHLRQRGHRVYIDDFGTGYSNLAYLHDLAVDAIKVDKAFTSAIGTEAVTVSILPQILAMAEALALQVVAEGVETELQANYFASIAQPILGQGWLFGHPVPAKEFHLLLAEDKKITSALSHYS